MKRSKPQSKHEFEKAGYVRWRSKTAERLIYLSPEARETLRSVSSSKRNRIRLDISAIDLENFVEIISDNPGFKTKRSKWQVTRQNCRFFFEVVPPYFGTAFIDKIQPRYYS